MILAIMVTADKFRHCPIMSLGDIAAVQPGYLSQSRIRDSRSGTHYLIQAKDVDPELGVRPSSGWRFSPERRAELYQVSRGDVLFAARGSGHWAHCISAELTNTLASNVFYIVRAKRDHVCPAYLAWWINQPEAQAFISTESRGTNIGYITRHALEQLPVKVPSIQIQEKIARVLELWRRGNQLQAELDAKRQQLMVAVFHKAIGQEQERNND